MELGLKLVSIPFFAAAAYFYFVEQGDRSLVAFVFAVSSLFLAYRFTLKRRLAERAESEIEQ